MMKYFVFLLFFIVNANAGVISTFSKGRVKKLYSKLKSEGKKPSLKKEKVKRDIFIAYNVKTKKVIKIFLSLRNANEYIALRGSHLKISKSKALVYKYTINYSEEDTPEFSEDNKQEEIESSFDFLPIRLRVVNGSDLGDEDYDLNYLTLSAGFEYLRGNFTLLANGLFQSYDVINEVDDDRFLFKEAFVKYDGPSYQFVIGPQIRVWGVFDELSELDVLTLKNTSRALFDDGAELRRPANLAYFSKYIGDSKLELVLNTGNERGYYSDINEKFYGINKSEGTLRGGTIPTNFANLLPLIGVVNKKRDSMGFAGRFSFSSNSSDYQIVFSKMLSDLPMIIVSEELLSTAKTLSVTNAILARGLSMEYQEVTTFGASFVRQMGNLIFKLELSYKDGNTYLTEDLENVVVTRLGSNIGGEYEFDANNSTLRFQINSVLLQSQETLTVDEQSHLLAGEYTKPMLGEKLHLGLRYSYEIEDGGYMLSPRVSYDITDNSSIELRGYMFEGGEESDLGFHKDDDFFELEYKLIF